ncbi:MAG: RagB/SusD family nutrient uptake outer membrane protein [Lewinellaceae bacterium]|nr:RagB/SusD family nutrient uptake outer membrane protein [Saprospiraceae bacterium]MCB9343486.1 RagB/SusD family nutrient uptake outer membrane protein [Lewinellaceae bacterium]
MKHRFHTYLLTLISVLILSCNKFHDEILPQDELPLSTVYQTAADLESAINGVYNVLQGNYLAGQNLIQIPELMSGNGTFYIAGIPESLDLANRNLRSSNLNATNFWIEAYKAINLANAVLEALGTVVDPALTIDLNNKLEGEALFIRAYLHFELVRYFGQPYGDNSPENGVPIATKAILKKSDITYPARASVQEVYDQVMQDLLHAGDLLPASQPVYRANPRAVKALLARVAFQMGDYGTASTYAKSLIEDEPGLVLNATPEEFYTNESSAEAIWVVKFTTSDASSIAFWFDKTRNRIGLSPSLKSDFEAIATPSQKSAAQLAGLSIVDLRSTVPLISSDTLFTNKYEDIAGLGDDTPMARLAEFILMRAEALARGGDMPGSIELLNQIRARSLRVRDASGNENPGDQQIVLFKPEDFADADALIDAIVLERRVELCFEGNYFQDLIRLHRDIEGLPFDACPCRLPIPQQEIDVNKNLKQNESCY